MYLMNQEHKIPSMVVKEGKPPATIQSRIMNVWFRVQRERRLYFMNRSIKAHSKPNHNQKPIVLFNASTRLTGFSQNAAFNLLTTWGLQVAGIPVKHFVCRAGMSRCVLGTDPDDPHKPLPCKKCINLSKRILRSSNVSWFDFEPDDELTVAVSDLNIDELSNFEWISRGIKIPLGKLVIPSLRWSLRRHHLQDEESTRYTLRSYLVSALNIAEAFLHYLDKVDPLVVVVFNGIMYPEAVVRWIALNRGIKVITHEVGFQPFSAFFSHGHATAYPMEIPDDFDLSEEQNIRLDEYLSRRRKGEFTMAGVRFWPEIIGLDDGFLQKAKQFKQVVPVFTNVINDTSQVHANTVFSHMYEWLDNVVAVIREYEDTFFVIRAHPDEKRIGTRKHSRQPVRDWIEEHGVEKLPNLIFIDSNEPLSSYELILESKFVFVYNSSIGLEASLLDVPVLCGGKARYTQYPTVFFPQTTSEYQEMARKFLEEEIIDVPSEFKRNSRRVLYWQLFRSSLPFGDFISAHPTPGYVQLRKFDWRDLLPENSPTIKVLYEGIVNGEPFILPE